MKITITFPFFFMIIFSVFGQGYKPMLTNNSEWHEYYTPGPNCNATLRIDGDSIVNGVAYKKIIAVPGCAAILNEGTNRLLRIWDYDRGLDKNLRITAGNTLTIQGTPTELVTFSVPKDGMITIEEGATLEVVDAILTNNCGQTWRGI